MKNIALLSLLTATGCAADYDFSFRIGDKFGDGWDGAGLARLERTYNASYTVTEFDFRDYPTEDRASPQANSDEMIGDMTCDAGDAIYVTALSNGNNTFLGDQDPPAQYWEMHWQIVVNGTSYHGGWNTKMAFRCDDYALLDWSENLLESVGSCPECQHPKPKPKPKPKGKGKSKGSDDDARRSLGGDDDGKKGKPKPPTKYWPVPVKLMDPTDRDGWFDADNMGYAEFTISDSSRMNLVAEGTLCAAKGSDGYSTVCENMLPDGHYIFRAAGHMDQNAGNYTWQLCGKEAVKYEIGMSDPLVTGMNATMLYDYRSATGRMGNEVAFQIKKGKCTVDETIVNLEDYANGTALDTVLALDGHVLLENVHFTELSSVESGFLEADLSEFVNLEAEKTVTLTSVESVNDGTLVGYRVIASHTESQLMHGTMDGVIEAACVTLQAQISSGGFLNFMKNSLQTAGLGNDKLMTVGAVQFVDLEFDNIKTLRNGETMSGDVVAGGDHVSAYNPIVSSDKVVSEQTSNSALVLDILTASGVFAVVAVIVVLVVTALKPPTESASGSSDIDCSSANLVVDEEAKGVVDESTSQMTSDAPQEFSYQDSLSAALTQRWEMNAEEDSVRL